MRKIIVGEFVSLDGVMEGPGSHDPFALAGWTEPYWDDAIGASIFETMSRCDTLLLGRITFEGFRGAFSSAPAEDPFASKMNSQSKYVVSSSLQTPDWNNSTIIKGSVIEEITKLKQQPGQDISVTGSASIVHLLMQHDLIDEYRLLVYPVVLGIGTRLFPEGSKAKLKLIGTQAFNSGVVQMNYEPDRAK